MFQMFPLFDFYAVVYPQFLVPYIIPDLMSTRLMYNEKFVEEQRPF